MQGETNTTRTNCKQIQSLSRCKTKKKRERPTELLIMAKSPRLQMNAKLGNPQNCCNYSEQCGITIDFCVQKMQVNDKHCSP